MLIAVIAAIGVRAQNYDFSQRITTGQTLFFKIIDAKAKTAEIVTEVNHYPYYTTLPCGNITLPGSIENNGAIYIVTSIGKNAFGYCWDLTGDLIIPDSVTSIEKYAFGDCSGLTGELIIPDSVTSIGEYAFYGCSGLKGDLKIDKTITTIGERAFEGCTGLTIKQ